MNSVRTLHNNSLKVVKWSGLRAHYVKPCVYEKEMSEKAIYCEIHQNILQKNKQRKVTKSIIKLPKYVK